MVVEIGAVAHGGHCVARHAGQVLFVRDVLPGETALVEVTSLGRKGRFVRASAVEVEVASRDRRVPPCPVSRRCGGCDFQHATPAAARDLKTSVVREALRRFASVELPEDFAVQEVALPGLPGLPPDAADGLHWRTRGTLAVSGAGAAGFLGARSHEVVVAGACPQLDPRLADLGMFTRRWPAGSRVGFVAPAGGEPLAFLAGEAPAEPIVERAAGRTWQVAADGFWQVHPGAPDALVDAVRDMLQPVAGERIVDLYSGVGLFGLSLAGSVEGPVELTLVEGERRACELAVQNAGALPVTVDRAAVDRWVRRPGALDRTSVVVLDPPRAGAGAAVVEAVVRAAPRAVAYVACDPVALARDLSTFATGGYRLARLDAFDLFPTTHHVECVAHLVPGARA